MFAPLTPCSLAAVLGPNHLDQPRWKPPHKQLFSSSTGTGDIDCRPFCWRAPPLVEPRGSIRGANERRRHTCKYTELFCACQVYIQCDEDGDCRGRIICSKTFRTVVTGQRQGQGRKAGQSRPPESVRVAAAVHDLVICCGSEDIARYRCNLGRDKFTFNPLYYLAVLERKRGRA